MSDSKGFHGEFHDSESGSTLLIEDDGRVAYAYLLGKEKKIVADIWLYNRCVAPEAPEWSDPGNLPFANPADYVDAGYELPLPSSGGDFFVEWQDRGAARYARILLGGQLFAELVAGAKPGWSRLAKKNGPLAKPLLP